MKKVLIVGGTGNIGHALLEELLTRGCEVTVLGKENPMLPVDGAVRAIYCDRTDEEAMRAAVGGQRYDAVYDLAAFDDAHVEMDWRLFSDCGQIVLASSAAVYGIASIQDMPVREDAPLTPARPYGVNKVKLEKAAMAHYIEDGWPVTIIRPSSCYGTQPAIFREIGMDPYWIDRIQKGKPFAAGNPQIVRNVLHVRDAALGFALTIDHPEHTVGQAYNLVGGTTLSWGQWHNTVLDILGKPYDLAVEIPIETLEAYGCPTMEQYKMSWQYHGFYSGEKLRVHMPEFVERVPLRQGVIEQLEFLMKNGLIKNCDESPWEDKAIRAQLATRVKR